MGKRSRSGRKAERERADRARVHGLPTSEGRRARAATPAPLSERSDESEDRSSDAPVVPLKRGIPTLAKVMVAAVVILLGVYLLSQKRDRELTAPGPEPSAAPAASSAN